MASMKTGIIEHIFFQRYDASTGIVAPTIVTTDDIVEAIIETGSPLNRRNPANFFKDLTRRAAGLIAGWPESVLKLGWYGEDAIGKAPSASFEFIPSSRRSTLDLSYDSRIVAHLDIQSLSMPVAMKQLGRRDENWLAQVSARLHVVETHFAVVSPRMVAQVDFLQTGVKLGNAEIDVAYTLTDVDNRQWLVAAEAKGGSEAFHHDQIRRAARAMSTSYAAAVGAVGVIPFGIKIVGNSLIHTIEFAPLDDTGDLRVVAQAAMRLVPDVTGIR